MQSKEVEVKNMKTLVKVLAAVTFALTCSVGFAHNRGGGSGHVGIGHVSSGHFSPHFGHFHGHHRGFFDYSHAYYPWEYCGYAPYYGWYYDPSYYSDRPIYESGHSLAVEVQETLATEGFYSGPIDGIVGPGTRAAIRRYQARAGLPVTGLIDRRLIDSMGLG